MTADFSSILSNAKLGEIEKPKPVPVGSYLAMVKNVEFKEGTGEKKTPFARVNLELVSAMEDVDQDALASAGGLQNKRTKVDFYLTDQAMFRLQDFILKDCALELNGMSLDQAIPQLTNQQVGVKIKHEVSTRDPDTVYAIVDSTFNPNA